MPPRRSMLGKRKNIPKPIPVQPPVSVTKHRLGMGSANVNCPQRLLARRQLWSQMEEPLNRNQKNKEQHFGAETKKREPADGQNILRTAKDKENFGSRFELNSFARETKGNVVSQCSQHITAETPILSEKIRTPRLANGLSIPEVPVLLKSNKSQRFACFTSQFSTQPRDLGEVFPVSDVAGTTIDAPEFVKSSTSQRLARFTSHFSTESSELGKTFPALDSEKIGNHEVPKLLKSNRSQRLAGFGSHFSTESTGLGKTFLASVSTGTRMSNVLSLLKSNRSRFAELTSHVSTEYNDGFCKTSSPGLVVTGTIAESNFLKSKRQGNSAYQNTTESGQHEKVSSHSGGADNLDAPVTSRSKYLGNTSQNEMESYGSEKEFVSNYGEVGTKAIPTLLIPNQLQSHGRVSYLQPHETDQMVAGSSDTLFKYNLPQGAGSFRNDGMKENKEVHNTLSLCYPTEKTSSESEKCNRTSGGSVFIRDGGTTNKLDSSKEHDNVSASYTDRISTECFRSRTTQPACGYNPEGSIVRSGRKRSRDSCTYLKSPLKKESKKAKFGEHDESHARSSLPCNKTASRLSEKSSRMTCNDEVYTDELSYPSPRVLLEKNHLSISANKTNSLQNNGTENSQNTSLLEFERNELCDSAYKPCCAKCKQTFRATNGGTLAVSVATQTDLLETSKTIETDNLICIKTAIGKLFSQINKREENFQKQSADIHNEMANIISMFNKQADKVNSDSIFGEMNNCLSENCKNLEMSPAHLVSRLPVRRSARLAARTSGTFSANNTISESTVVPATPTQLESEEIDNSDAKSVAVARLNKSGILYKDLRSSIPFLKTPQTQDRQRPLAKIPKNTPNRMLSRRVQNQLVSLYD